MLTSPWYCTCTKPPRCSVLKKRTLSTSGARCSVVIGEPVGGTAVYRSSSETFIKKTRAVPGMLKTGGVGGANVRALHSASALKR